MKMTRSRLAAWLFQTMIWLLVGVVALSLFEGAALDRREHLALHAQLDSTAATGLTQEGVERATDRLIACLRTGSVEGLSYTDEVYGKTVPVFNAREIAHMRDVAGLFTLLSRVRLAMLAAAIVLLMAGLIVNKRGKVRPFTLRGMRNAALFWLFSFLAVAVFAMADFERAFLLMHGLLFDNGLWMLNPETDLMIRLLPEAFFSGLAQYIAGAIGIGLAAIAAIGWIGGRKK
ncbi:MAG: TIGR01906 family membrane protein [Clostridia bacterium]